MTQDTQIRQDVLAGLRVAPSVVHADIGIAVSDGVVTLAGFVGSALEGTEACKAAQDVRDVETVVDDLQVHSFESADRTDDEILSAACNRLRWNDSISADTVDVHVENGHVRLTGQVDWHFQRDAAEKAVRTLIGVVGVTNDIAMNPEVDAENIRVDIMRALNRPSFSIHQIGVATAGGQITLTGTVHSRSEFVMASDTAWAARGATGVANDIVVV